jgi:hypothetical protein
VQLLAGVAERSSGLGAARALGAWRRIVGERQVELGGPFGVVLCHRPPLGLVGVQQLTDEFRWRGRSYLGRSH